MRRAVLLSCLALTLGVQQAHALSRENVLHSFTGNDGAYPQTGLVADKAGNLYGTTALGGDNDNGVVFAVDTQGNFKVIHRFQGAPNDGANPNASLVMDKNGVLYGTAAEGGAHGRAGTALGGTVFRLVPNGDGTWTESTLYDFCAKKHCIDGDTPVGPVTLDKDGSLYGTTEIGGNGVAGADHGTVFRLTPESGGAWTYKVLYDFCSQPDCADGAYPFSAPLLLTKSGLIYGTTSSLDHGTLYAMAKDGSFYRVLHTFGASGDGTRAYGGVIAGPNGVLYGMTNTGGANGCGIAYSYDPSSSTYDIFHSFCADEEDAGFPEGGFLMLNDAKGFRLYGLSADGGEGNDGAIFKFTPGSGSHWKERLVYSFCTQTGCDDGYRAVGALLRHRGVFYGATNRGGANDTGVVFRFGWER